MTFTYTPSATPSDTTRIRFALGDVDSTAAKFSDEEIAMQIAEQSTWQRAVIALLQGLIAKMSIPNFTADWLQVDATTARKDLMWLLQQKRNEYGISALSVETDYAYRPDSRQNQAPDFDDVQDSEPS